MLIRGTPILVQSGTTTAFSTAPSGAPTADEIAAMARLAPYSAASRSAYIAIDANGAATLGGGTNGVVWLCRYSNTLTRWRRVGRLGDGKPIVLTATLGWEEPLDEILSGAGALRIWDENGPSQTATISVYLGTLG